MCAHLGTEPCAHAGNDEVGVYELVKFNKGEVFPAEYFGSLVALLEEKIEEELAEEEDDINDAAPSVVSSSQQAASSSSVLRQVTRRRGSAKATDGQLFKAFKASQGGPVKV